MEPSCFHLGENRYSQLISFQNIFNNKLHSQALTLNFVKKRLQLKIKRCSTKELSADGLFLLNINCERLMC